MILKTLIAILKLESKQKVFESIEPLSDKIFAVKETSSLSIYQLKKESDPFFGGSYNQTDIIQSIELNNTDTTYIATSPKATYVLQTRADDFNIGYTVELAQNAYNPIKLFTIENQKPKAIFSNNEYYLVIQSFKKTIPVIHVWNLFTNSPRNLFKLDNPKLLTKMTTMALSPSNEFLCIGTNDGKVYGWKLKEGKYLGFLDITQITNFNHYIEKISFSSDTQHLIIKRKGSQSALIYQRQEEITLNKTL